jgi:hypothetical protein
VNDNLESPTEQRPHGAHHGHGLMMIMCAPMLVIAVLLVATGVASPGILVGAAMCAVMMAVMMRGMSHAGH